jgi:hypothetical protein
VTGLQVYLHNPQPTKKAPTTVLRRASTLVVNLTECGCNHIDEMVEPTTRYELSWSSDKFDELFGVRLPARGLRKLGDFLCVRLSARDSDRQAALDERIRLPLSRQIGSNECLN